MLAADSRDGQDVVAAGRLPLSPSESSPPASGPPKHGAAIELPVALASLCVDIRGARLAVGKSDVALILSNIFLNSRPNSRGMTKIEWTSMELENFPDLHSVTGTEVGNFGDECRFQARRRRLGNTRGSAAYSTTIIITTERMTRRTMTPVEAIVNMKRYNNVRVR